MEYLQYKWREFFLLLDVNMDNVLDSADMELEAADFARMNNLTDTEVHKLISLIVLSSRLTVPQSINNLQKNVHWWKMQNQHRYLIYLLIIRQKLHSTSLK